MNESEPAAMKWLRWILPKRKKQEEILHDAKGLTKSTRSELMEIMNDRRQSAPMVVHMLRTLQDRIRVPLDTRVLRAYAEKLQASAQVVEAISMLERGMFENSVLREQLGREERARQQEAEMRDLTHDVNVLELERKKRVLKGPLPEMVEEARLIAELKKLTGRSEASVLEHFQSVLALWKDTREGEDRLVQVTDEEIETVYRAKLDAIPPNAPNAEALRRAAAVARDNLIERRNWMLQETARYLAEKLAADRRKKDKEDQKR